MRLSSFLVGHPVRLRSLGKFVDPREGRIVEALPTEKVSRRYFRVVWADNGNKEVLEEGQIELAREVGDFTDEDRRAIKAGAPKKIGRPKGTGGRGGLDPTGPRQNLAYEKEYARRRAKLLAARTEKEGQK